MYVTVDMYVYTSHTAHTVHSVHMYCSIIDVSEMVDTYGAELSEVKAFVRNGWATCKATSGKSLVMFHYVHMD